MDHSVIIQENTNGLVEVKNEIDIKSETFIKQDNITLFKGLYDQVFQSITEANLNSLKSIELSQQLSDIGDVKDHDGTAKHFTEVIDPLKSAVDSFTLSINALHFIGKTLITKLQKTNSRTYLNVIVTYKTCLHLLLQGAVCRI